MYLLSWIPVVTCTIFTFFSSITKTYSLKSFPVETNVSFLAVTDWIGTEIALLIFPVITSTVADIPGRKGDPDSFAVRSSYEELRIRIFTSKLVTSSVLMVAVDVFGEFAMDVTIPLNFLFR